MGGHFYDCKGTPYLTEARTPVQARKIKAYPSVTTVLSIQMNDFLHNIWMPRKLVELARDNPTMPVQEIQELKYGQRVCPATGNKISSSSFGTSVHARLEEVLNHRIFGEGLENEGTPFDDWAEPFIDFIDKNNIKPLATEKIVYCDKMKSAGSVDLIAEVDGKVHLFDYKCRDTKGTGGKFYEEKDCTQLAIESKWLQQSMDLHYEPMVTSVCICTESKKHYHKNWTKTQMRKAVTRFRYLNRLYRIDWMKAK